MTNSKMISQMPNGKTRPSTQLAARENAKTNTANRLSGGAWRVHQIFAGETPRSARKRMRSCTPSPWKASTPSQDAANRPRKAASPGRPLVGDCVVISSPSAKSSIAPIPINTV